MYQRKIPAYVLLSLPGCWPINPNSMPLAYLS